MTRSDRTLAVLAGAAAAAATLWLVEPLPSANSMRERVLTTATAAPTPLPRPEVTGSPVQGTAGLQGLVVAPHRDVPGYDRDARFGDWEDMDRDGCDTRETVLLADLVDVVVGDGCEVLAGRLDDPYTGGRIRFRSGNAVQIEHVVPLCNAWDAGAHAWTDEQRVAFANDLRNLLAVDGPTNASKGCRTVDQWRPPARDSWCQVATITREVKRTYRLTVTPDEAGALLDMLVTC